MKRAPGSTKNSPFTTPTRRPGLFCCLSPTTHTQTHPRAQTSTAEGTPDGPGPRDPEEDALREVPAVPPAPARPARPAVAEQADRGGAAVVLGRPPRREPGAHRPDGPGPQAPDVRHARPDGLQGD